MTVISSLTLVFGPNGEQRYVVANASDLYRELSKMMMQDLNSMSAHGHAVQTRRCVGGEESD
jgi:hypothetical protein